MTGSVGEVSRAEQAPRRPLWARVSAGQAVMVLAALAAFVLNLNVIRSQQAVVMVAVAAEDLSPGVTLDAGMLRFVEIDAENPVVARLVTEESMGVIDGQVLTSRVPEGEFVSLSALADQATESNLRAMTVPVDPSHAGGGSLIQPGDLVDIISVVDGSARYVVAGAQVLRVPEVGTAGLVATSDYYLVIAVDADTALAVAEALQADSIEIVLATGSPTPERMSLDDDAGVADVESAPAVDEAGG